MRSRFFDGPRTTLALVSIQLSALVVPIFIFGILSALPATAHMKGMYDTKEEAEKRAAQLKCKGVFQMGDMWMPCASERALHDALQRQ
jgi:hypothetical protein